MSPGAAVRTTQDGVVLEQTDRTFVTSQGTVSTDPILGWVRYGAGSPLLPTLTRAPGPSIGTFQDAYNLTVAPGETSYLLFYGLMGGTVAQVSTLLQSFSSDDTMRAAGLLNGLSDATLARIANYNLAPADIPEPGTLALLLVGTLTTGAEVLRRRV